MAHPGRPEGDHGSAPVTVLRVATVLADSLRIWRSDLRPLIVAAGLEFPLIAAEIALHVTPGLKAVAEDSFTLTGAALVVSLYGALSHHFLAGLLEQDVGAARRGHDRPTLSEILRDLPWYRLVIADLLLTAMVAVGLVFFIVPGLIALTWFSVTLPIVNLEGNPVGASFRRSYQLVRGHSWRVFAVAGAAFAVPEMAIAALAALTHHLTNDVVLNAIGHGIAATVLMPIAALPIVVLAFELVDLGAAAAPALSGPNPDKQVPAGR